MKKDVFILPAFALFYTIFHLLFYNTLEYHRDELFYYLTGIICRPAIPPPRHSQALFHSSW